MANKCDTCTEKCPQAERAHNVALGRMYATKEFVSLVKKVDSGELVEVVRCKDCKHSEPCEYGAIICTMHSEKGDGKGQGRYNVWMEPEDFCSYGERRK